MVTETRSENDHEMIIGQIEARLAAGLSETRLSNEAEIPLPSLQAVRKREPVGIRRDRYDEAVEKLAKWLGNSQLADGRGQHARANTPTFQAITSAMRLARDKQKIVAITGSVGIGKSEAAQAFALAHPMTLRAPGVLRIEFDSTDKKPTAALARIAAALSAAGSGRPGYRNANLMDAIGAALRPGDTLILDEYNHLEGAAVNIARDIHQRFGIGVVMLGNPEFADRVWGKSEEFAALANRAVRFHFDSTTEDDVDAWLNWMGLYGQKLRHRAIKIAARPGRNGGLRTLAVLIENIRNLYGKEVDDRLLEMMAANMGRL